MISTTETLGVDLSQISRRVSTFVELTKPRLVSMILINNLSRLLYCVLATAQLAATDSHHHWHRVISGRRISPKSVP